jgi:hypothetical protein
MITANAETVRPDYFTRKQFLMDSGYIDCAEMSADSHRSKPCESVSKSKTENAIVLTGSTDVKAENSLKDSFVIPRRLFSANGYKLKAVRNVAIVFKRGSCSWFAANEKLDIFATGDSIEEANHEFTVMIIDFYQHYRDLPKSRALPRALRLKQLFEKIFTEHSE